MKPYSRALSFAFPVCICMAHTLHYIHYITLYIHYVTLHYITFYFRTLHYITLHYISFHYIILHYITFPYNYYIILYNITLHIEFHLCVFVSQIWGNSSKNRQRFDKDCILLNHDELLAADPRIYPWEKKDCFGRWREK